VAKNLSGRERIALFSYLHQVTASDYQKIQESQVPKFVKSALHLLDLNEWDAKMKQEFEEDISNTYLYSEILDGQFKLGEENAKRGIIIRLINQNLPDELICNVAEITKEQLDEIKGALKASVNELPTGSSEEEVGNSD
jgi:hypothetical protein